MIVVIVVKNVVIVWPFATVVPPFPYSNDVVYGVGLIVVGFGSWLVGNTITQGAEQVADGVAQT